ncbi:MAG: hypothetical protein KDC54_10580, partial [Lewinella sp.]|nr:hypothetical protein [Lewinella sp.]
MQALLKRISLTLVIVLCSAMVLHAQDNTFTGAVDSNWDLAANWSTGWPPSQHIYQKITIAADCVLPASNTVHYAFHQGSTLQIKVGVSFTNLGTGGWEMYGEIVNEGTYQQTSFNSQGVFAQTGTFVGTLFNDGEITP